ncbi:amidohydrolase [Algoriphagus limi]|uniref:Amidohydrolase n=1 Tax=Algoriphagus limi TaxID=2975273 RepID=A0ABT2GC59_9BACT|nr:amidohydrolase [Algoriphagus limi]MCS5491976.1 amidohydrolase [Algoriphagus limi]
MSPAPNLQIALIQTDLFWKDRVANLAMLEEKIWQIQGPVDLILLPEMFPTGFTMEVKEVGEPMNLHVTKWMQQMAKQKKSVVAGSAIIHESGKYYNRLLWVSPSGKVDFYDKRHLFRMADEHQLFSAGNQLPIFEIKGWKICPQICYDLRFPVWSRNKVQSEGQLAYDLIFYVASWPAARVSAWDALLPARAIENLAYSIGLNRVGTDGNKILYNGHSAAYDFKGECLLNFGEEESIQIVNLDLEKLKEYRKKFPAWRDGDSFQLE